MKIKITNIKNQALTETEYNNLIDKIFNSKIKDVKNNLLESDNPADYIKQFKSDLFKNTSQIKLNQFNELEKQIFDNDKTNLLNEIAEAEMMISLGENQQDFNTYSSLIIYCEDKKIKDVYNFIKEYANYKALQFVSEECDKIYRESILNENKEIEKYAINTQEIYHGLSNCWSEISKVRINEVEGALINSLSDTIPITVGRHYIKRYQNLLNLYQSNDLFPILPYFVKRINQRDKNLCAIVSFEELNVVVEKDNNDFNLLFAIQFYVTDVMETDGFLNFHLKKSFLNNRDEYRRFLEKICIKYNDFLSNKHEPLIKLFTQYYLSGNNNENVTVSEENKPTIKSEIINKIAPVENFEDFINNIKKLENKFCTTMPINIAIKHFIVFTKENSKDGKPFLTEKNFILFFKRVFLNDNLVEKITLNVGSREKSYVVKRFYEFYQIAIEFEKTNQCKNKYINLLSENFNNWSYEKLKDNFNNKSKKKW